MLFIENGYRLITKTLKSFLHCVIDDRSTLIQVTAWRRKGRLQLQGTIVSRYQCTRNIRDILWIYANFLYWYLLNIDNTISALFVVYGPYSVSNGGLIKRGIWTKNHNGSIYGSIYRRKWFEASLLSRGIIVMIMRHKNKVGASITAAADNS